MDLKAREDNHEDGIVKSKLEKENQGINRNDDKQDGNDEQTWTEIKQKRRINGKKNKENLKQAEGNADDQRVNKRFSTVVIGNSTIFRLQGWRMSYKKNKVVVRSFAGSRINDSYHYLVPSLETKPNRVILHIRTNDLKDEEVRKVAEKIVKLSRKIS